MLRGALAIFIFLLSVNFVFCLERCTDADLKAIYTYCANENSTRSLYWYYSDTCDSSGMNPPARVDNLPCDITCNAGTYLPYGETSCKPCETGKYSVGGGLRFFSFSDWPQDKTITFNHYCSKAGSYLPPTAPLCDGWVVNNTYLESGFHQANVNSVLDIGFTTVKPGYIAFTYMSISKSPSPALKMQVNFNSAFSLKNSVDFSYILLNITTPGTHHVRWAYYLGDDPSPFDYARIGYIEISGLARTENYCTPCPNGRYQDRTGGYSCTQCDNSHYSDIIGASTCTPCPTNTFSFLGSSSCIPQVGKCNVDTDATAFYSECTKSDDGWTRTKFYYWNSPLTCDNSQVTLPAAETVPCDSCPSNMIDHTEFRCTTCDFGTYSDQGECKPSVPGTAAVPAIYYTQWNQLSFPSGSISTSCLGKCANKGWSFFEDHIGTYYVGDYVDMYFSIAQTFSNFAGSISFDYLFKSSSAYSTFQFAIDSQIVGNFPATNTRNVASFNVSEGTHTFTWYFHNGNPSNPLLDKNTFVNIYSVNMTGTFGGSADDQVNCSPGYYQPSAAQSICIKCPKGTYSDSYNSLSCTECPENTATDKEGSTTCTPCPYGTQSNPGSAFCVNPDCIWYTDESQTVYYNLSPFSGQYQYVGNQEPYFSGYYVISYCGFVSSSSFGCENSFICEDFSLFNPVDPTVGYLNWASSVSINPMSNPYEGYILEYRNGDSKGCPNGESRSVDVIFSCEMDVTKFTPLTLDTDRSTECHLVMTQGNYYGCPICSAENFTRSEGPCVDGEMTVSYTKNEGINCNGIMRDTIESCGDISIKIGLLLVGSLIVFILLLALTILVVVIYQKNKRLTHKYKELQKSVASSVEMEDVSDT